MPRSPEAGGRGADWTRKLSVVQESRNSPNFLLSLGLLRDRTRNTRKPRAPVPYRWMSDMTFQITFDLVERLRQEAIGNPQWMPSTGTYEYTEHSARVVAILKLIRAAHGVAASELLRLNGLFIDLGMITRGVFDAVEEVYFLLEEYPNTSRHVDQFVKAFFESDINGYLSGATNDVRKKHIRSARVRCLNGAHDQASQDLLERIFRTFSGYVHAKYAHVMEVYGGAPSFNLSGVPSAIERLKRAEHVVLQANSVIHAVHFAAQKFKLPELERDIQTVVRENLQ